MSELVEINENQLLTLSNDQLIEEFKSSLSITVHHIQKMAVIWKILTERGVDLSAWKKGLLEFLPQIATGNLLPEVITEFAGQKNLILTLSRIPTQKQKLLLDAGTVQKLDITGDNQEIVKDVELTDLKNSDLAQVFKENDIRDVGEQRLYLLKNSLTKPKEDKTKRKTLRKVEISGKYLLIGDDSQILLESILHQLSENYHITEK
ncbi:hypothetical protein [Acinetobacter venetianus]|uniref:Uncharacterized protein n=1 Tax=Acinetobacter venetianus TaxID=52133 RepID=A0A150HY16_9GAMM|nr:hypothetical protein [Acinetobacter venetianus]KXZ72117.1 hypothetical protein AVENLUH13518_00728 [Acinetobacter venetianus]